MLKSLFFREPKKGKIEERKDIEPNEIFLDHLGENPDRKVERPVSRNAFRLLLAFCFLLLFALFGRAFQLQVLQFDKMSVMAERNKFINQSLVAERGVIYDQEGKQLVYNKPSFDLIIKKSAPRETIEEISRILGKDFQGLSRLVEEGEQEEVVVVKGLNHQPLVLLKTKMQELSGAEIKNNYTRKYLEDSTFSHVLGYTGIVGSEDIEKDPEVYSGLDYVGRAGIEKFYEKELRKDSGNVKIERNASGEIISRKVDKMPKPGNSLVLWLDYDLQMKAKESLEKKLEEIGSEKAVAVALDPDNGAVLALVSIPGYNNNLFNRDSNKDALQQILSDENNSLFNRALSGRYPTGSVIKPLVATAALEEGLVSPEKPINCQGAITIEHRYNPEIVYTYKDWAVHGPTDLRKAIAESCNVYFYTIGGGYKEQEGLGPSRIKHYLELFGWGKDTGIDFPSEYSGFIPSPEWKKEQKGENWWDGDTYNLSIGQGDILIPPLQVAVSFAAIANGGTIYSPRIAKEIIDSEGNTVKKIESDIIKKNLADPNNLKIVREGMRKGVTGEGAPQASSVLLNSLPVEAAAKTGTAQTQYEEKYHNWVTVFAPYDNPEIVLTVMVEEVEGVRSATLPVAKEILNWYFNDKEKHN